MPPILFTFSETRCARGNMLGVGPSFQGGLPLPVTRLSISGITKDSTGIALGSCTVTLYRTSDDLLMERVVSDPSTGAYSFSSVGGAETYYVVAYLAGSPDVAGTTVNTLVGA
jgi:hypothetical protein